MEKPVACLQDIEDIAIRKLPQNALGYYKSGSDGMQTLKDNFAAFDRLVYINII